MRIPELLLNIRDVLADPKEERWTNDRLIRLINEAQKALARRFDLLRGEISIQMDINQVIYKLPEDCWAITRCDFDRRRLDLKTYYEMDAQDPDWQLVTGSRLEAIVYDQRNVQEIRVYPTPNDSFAIDYYSITPEQGVTTEFEGVPAAPEYGILADVGLMPGQLAHFPSEFGVVGDVYTTGLFSIKYIRDPKRVLTINDELEIPPMFDTAIKQYVIGNAFMDDIDTRYQEKGLLALRLYEAEAELIGSRAKQHDSVRAATFSQPYRGFV